MAACAHALVCRLEILSKNLVNYWREMVEKKYLIEGYSTVIDNYVLSQIFLPSVSYGMTCI